MEFGRNNSRREVRHRAAEADTAHDLSARDLTHALDRLAAFFGVGRG